MHACKHQTRSISNDDAVNSVSLSLLFVWVHLLSWVCSDTGPGLLQSSEAYVDVDVCSIICEETTHHTRSLFLSPIQPAIQHKMELVSHYLRLAASISSGHRLLDIELDSIASDPLPPAVIEAMPR